MFDIRPVGYVIGLLVAALGAAMLLPLGLDLLMRNGHWPVFLESSLVTMLIGAVIFFQAGNEAVALFQRLGQLMELEIELPIWWMYLAFPTGFAILILFSLELLLETLRDFASYAEAAS